MIRYISFFFLFLVVLLKAQIHKNDTISVEKYPKDSLSIHSKDETKILADIESSNKIAVKPKYSPIRAGLYSAVLPGLGQYYNKKYWKIPVVWGAVGVGVGITLWNEKQYNRYRNAFIAELNGQKHEFSGISGATKEALGRTQDSAKRQRDYAIAITGLIYVLNIVDAVVDAHLYAQKHDPDLVFKPIILYDEFTKQNAKAGLSLSYRF